MMFNLSQPYLKSIRSSLAGLLQITLLVTYDTASLEYQQLYLWPLNNCLTSNVVDHGWELEVVLLELIRDWVEILRWDHQISMASRKIRPVEKKKSKVISIFYFHQAYQCSGLARTLSEDTEVTNVPKKVHLYLVERKYKRFKTHCILNKAILACGCSGPLHSLWLRH